MKPDLPGVGVEPLGADRGAELLLRHDAGLSTVIPLIVDPPGL